MNLSPTQQAIMTLSNAAMDQLMSFEPGTRVKLMFHTDRVWTGEIVNVDKLGVTLRGKRNATRHVVRNVNNGVGYFIEMRGYRSAGDFAVVKVEKI